MPDASKSIYQGMKYPEIPTLLLMLILFSCQSQKVSSQDKDYLRWVGDIEQDAEIDDPGFKICRTENEVFQYFNLQAGPVYEGEKTALLHHFSSNYKAITAKNQDGLIRIRFVVNCQGEAGRFRVMQSDYQYREKKFDEEVINQLLTITKDVDGWSVLRKDELPVDYYMYLVFKMNDGHIKEILP